MIAYDAGAMQDLGRALADVGEGFDALATPVRSRADDAVEVAGEFSPELAPGGAVFAPSWTSALRAYAECCQLLSSHVGASSVPLQALDAGGAASLRAPR